MRTLSPWSSLVLVLFCLGDARGAWIEFGDGGSWKTNDAKSGAAQKIKEVREAGEKLTCVAFTPGEAWVLLMSGDGFHTSNLQLPVCRKLAALKKEGGHAFKCVAFSSSGGWAVLFDKNGYVAEGIPGPALAKLGEIAQANDELKWIAFTAAGGWCILHGKGGHSQEGIPANCLKHMEEVTGTGELKTVSFASSSGYALFFDRSGFYAEDIPDGAFQAIANAAKKGSPRSIAFPVARHFDPNARYVLDHKPSHHIHATLDTDLFMPNAKVDEWIIYAPEFPNLPSQREVKTVFSLPNKIVREESPLHRPVMLSRITDGRKKLRAVLTVDATLFSRQLRPLEPGETAPPAKELTKEQMAHFTRSCETCDYASKPMRQWIARNKLMRETGESDLAFAHRVFSFVKHHNTYEWPTKNGTASQVCLTQKSDCGGLSALFTATVRAGGLPARLLGGRWADSQKPGDKTGDYGHWHVKAEFYARGVGWVPVDASSSLSSPDGDETCFGNDHGDFVTFMTAEDIVLKSFTNGPSNSGVMQGIVYWWHGSGDDKGSKDDELWTVTKTD